MSNLFSSLLVNPVKSKEIITNINNFFIVQNCLINITANIRKLSNIMSVVTNNNYQMNYCRE